MEEKKIKYGVIHCHTDNSMKDSALTVEQLVEKAVELGAPSITLTDHGTMMGIDTFMNLCKSKKVNGVPGVECYYQEDDGLKREHLLLLAKNQIGLKAVQQIVTESNKRIDSKGFPRVNLEILKRNIGHGSEGYGNVIVTSACVGGILSSVLLETKIKSEEVDKLKKQISKYKSPSDKSYLKNKEKLKEIENNISDLLENKAELIKLSKKSLKGKKRTADIAQKKGDIETYNQLLEELQKEEDEIKSAGMELENVKKKISSLTIQKKDLTNRCSKDEVEHEKRKNIEKQLVELTAKLDSEEQLYQRAKEKAKIFDNLVGHGNFYIELQNHFIEEEEYVMPKLASIAKELQIPVVAANDVHIPDNSEESLKARQLMRSLRYNKWEERRNGDEELYMKTDSELSSALSKILPADIVKEAMENVGKIFNSCHVELDNSSHYPKFISDRDETSDEALRRLAYEGIERRFPDKKSFTEVYQKRLEYELDVIIRMGYSDYHLITQDFLNFGRKLGKLSDENLEYVWNHIENWDLSQYVDYVNNHMTEAGYSIGPGRGSAAGSLVCYLLGITSIDPIKFDLLFERFLNVERVSMPDIDSDLSPRVRDLVIEYVKKKYGKDSVCCIMTRGTQKPRAAIRNVARVMGDRDGKSYLNMSDEMAKNVPFEVGMNFNKCYADLADKYKENEIAMEVLDGARLIEDRLQSIGMHAAGVIISDGNPVSDYVSLMWDNKYKRWKSQCDMVQAEGRGLLKMDFLGLNNLNIITDTLRLIRERYGNVIDIENIPYDKAVFENIYSKGFTNAIFQFESGGMKDMLKKFRPSSIEDVILLVAAYRPGPMQYLEKIINVKHGKEKLKYLVPELEPILKNTYGSIIYQEQVQQIFRNLAGYSLGQADMVRRAMSKKKEKVLVAERQSFVYGDEERNIIGCKNNGIDEEKANQMFDEMIDFAKYAFNKSHAAAYAVVSYQTAWLKYYYPKEFLCSVMSNVPIEKIPILMDDCKRLGITVLPPRINESSVTFSIKDDAILFGLGAVKNVGEASDAVIQEIKEHGKFVSFKDFIKRAHRDSRVTSSLIEAGAFDAFGTNRRAMNCIVETLSDNYKKSVAKEILIEEIQEKIADMEKKGEKETSKDYKTLVRRLNNAVSAKETADEIIMKTTIPVMSENLFERLKAEKDKIGIFVSAHPLDEYNISDKMGYTKISDLVDGEKVTLVGLITDVRKKVTKKKKEPMAFFKLEDKTGVVDINCFPKSYEKYGKYIKEDAVVIIDGTCKEEVSFNDENEFEKKINVESIREIHPVRKQLVLHVNGIDEWLALYEQLKGYYSPEGYQLLIHDEMLNEFRTTDLIVSSEILYNKLGLRLSERNTVA